MKKLLISLVVAAFIVPSATFASIDANLKYGSRGMEVTELQEFLIDKGFLTGQTSGNFFALTRKAVIAWQASVGLPATGFVGSMSRAKINEDLSTANASAVSAEVAETGTTSLIQTQTTSSTASFNPGCISSRGFSTTTGKPCSASIAIQNTTANKTITFPNGSIAEIDSRGDVVRWIKEAIAVAQSSVQSTQNQTTSSNQISSTSIITAQTTISKPTKISLSSQQSYPGLFCSKTDVVVRILDQDNKEMIGQQVEVKNTYTGVAITGPSPFLADFGFNGMKEASFSLKIKSGVLETERLISVYEPNFRLRTTDGRMIDPNYELGVFTPDQSNGAYTDQAGGVSLVRTTTGFVCAH